MKRWNSIAMIIGALLVVAACSDSTPGTAVSDADPGGGASGDTEPSSSGDVSGAAPIGEPFVEGLTEIVVLGPSSSEAGEAPLFRWEPVDQAATYDLVVLGPEGPLWAWQGAETEIWLGGLPFERPPGVSGPSVVDGTCWSVVARDSDGHVVAASAFLAVSPAESTSHSCVPGN